MGEGELFSVSVLYVEDEAITREEVLRFLRRRVSTVFDAANGKEGMALFRQRAPDLVVTDIRMPVMDGLRMAREIRAQNRDIPIIVTTAYGDSAYLMEAIEAGVDRYVMKPVEAEKLLAAVGKCAEVVEHRRAAQRYHEERERLVSELRDALEGQTAEWVPSYLRQLQEDQGRQWLLAADREIHKGPFRGGVQPRHLSRMR